MSQRDENKIDYNGHAPLKLSLPDILPKLASQLQLFQTGFDRLDHIEPFFQRVLWCIRDLIGRFVRGIEDLFLRVSYRGDRRVLHGYVFVFGFHDFVLDRCILKRRARRCIFLNIRWYWKASVQKLDFLIRDRTRRPQNHVRHEQHHLILA